MSAYNWSCFTKRINVKAPAHLLYYAWSTQQGMENWFLRLSEFTTGAQVNRDRQDHVQAGDKYKWLWHGWPDTMIEYGEIVEANGEDFIKFTFGGASRTNMTVSVTIKNEEGENIVELSQENIPDDDEGRSQYHLGCMEGWTFYLVNLKSTLEGGLDLRNKNEKLQKVINS